MTESAVHRQAMIEGITALKPTPVMEWDSDSVDIDRTGEHREWSRRINVSRIPKVLRGRPASQTESAQLPTRNSLDLGVVLVERRIWRNSHNEVSNQRKNRTVCPGVHLPHGLSLFGFCCDREYPRYEPVPYPSGLTTTRSSANRDSEGG